MKGNQKVFITKLPVFFILLIVFWVPYFYLVRFQRFSEGNSLLAAVISLLLLIFIFVPAAQNLLTRITSVKISGFEIEFKKTIEESSKRTDIQKIPIILDPGREVICQKAGIEEFISVIEEHLAYPKTKIVLTVDLKQGEKIYLPMLYFQTKIFSQLFDLRALLFIDSRYDKQDKSILGTILPDKAIDLISKYIPNIDSTFYAIESEVANLLERGDIKTYISQKWHRISESLPAVDNFRTGNRLRLEEGVFRTIFAEQLELNILHFPFNDYEKLYNYMISGQNHVILIKKDKTFTVRTIDHLAREISQKAIMLALA